jgi:glycosyltransferase involved in cell wall biosynthesis
VTALNLLRGLPAGVRAILACPPGPLAEEAREAGVDVVAIAGTSGSLRLHPVGTARAVAEIGRLAVDVRRLARRTRADLVHATTIRAGLAAVQAGRRPPVIVSLHDCLPPGPVTALTQRLVDARAAALLANSRYTARAWRGGRAGPPMRVAYPAVDLARYRPPSDRAGTRVAVGLGGSGPILGVAAQITPWKAQATAIRALARVRERFADSQLILAGEAKFVAQSTRYDNRVYLASLRRLISELGLDSCVHFLGQRDDMPAVLGAVDVLLVPSWEEPFGLVAVEAMAVGTPVVATSIGGPPEFIVDGENGRLVPPRWPELWADAVVALLSDPRERERIARAGLATAARFGREEHVRVVLEAYRSAAPSAAF